MRRDAVLAVTLPLAVGGLLMAHALAYRFAYGASSTRALAETGRGYLAYAPMVLALLGSFAVVSLMVLAAPAVRWGLVLQAPFALTAWLIARFALRSAAAVARRVGPKTARHGRLCAAFRSTPQVTAPARRLAPLASNRGGRAPPVIVGL